MLADAIDYHLFEKPNSDDYSDDFFSNAMICEILWVLMVHDSKQWWGHSLNCVLGYLPRCMVRQTEAVEDHNIYIDRAA